MSSFYSHLPAYEDGTECSETSAYKFQMPGNYPKEGIQHSLLNDESLSFYQQLNVYSILKHLGTKRLLDPERYFVILFHTIFIFFFLQVIFSIYLFSDYLSSNIILKVTTRDFSYIKRIHKYTEHTQTITAGFVISRAVWG